MSYFIMRETGSREDGDFLSSGDTVHGVDGRDAGLDHFLGVDPRPGVDWLTWRRSKDIKYKERQFA